MPVTQKSPTALGTKLDKAHARFERQRQKVVNQGTARKASLVDLKAEIEADLAQVENVLSEAVAARKR